jgi:DUF4097 and DUF4098 domain-containing protein YvlB
MRKAALALTLFMATTIVAEASYTETFDRTVNLQPGGTVELENVNGKIRISAWDQPQVRIHAVKKIQNENDGDAAAFMKQLRIDVRQQGSTLRIETINPRKEHGIDFLDFIFGDHVQASVEYELTVPRSINLKVDNTNGSITATELSGEIDLETTNGRIEVVRCSGSVDAETTNGAISVELVQVRSGRPMSFETTNGRINLSVPSNMAADIDASTTNGRIESEIPITTKSSSKRSLRGSLNGGGTDITLRTTNGGISIRPTSAVAAR